MLKSNAWTWGLALLCLAGCGDGRPTRVPVSGKVLIDGQPLKFGAVQFVPHGSRASSGTLDESGRFTLTCFVPNDGAVIGTHRVAVLGVEPLGSTAQRWHAPKKYADFSTSGVTAEVTGPADDLVVEITWAGGKPFIERFEGE